MVPANGQSLCASAQTCNPGEPSMGAMFQTALPVAKHLTALWLLLFAPAALATPESGATALIASHTALQSQLQASTFGEPLYLTSHEQGDRVDGDVYAEMALPFARVSTVLSSAESVCGLLFLHLNIRSCLPSLGASGKQLAVSVGPKQAATPGTLYSMTYAMTINAATANYLNVSLAAATGPLATQDYRIVFEATPLPGGRTFLHFSYSYDTGVLARLAMGAYLATAGRSKIGFTVTSTGADGQPHYVQGERGSVERNVIRNYLALLAYSSITTGTPQAQTQARQRAWFALTERHAAQLHELSLNDYLHEKQIDLDRLPP